MERKRLRFATWAYLVFSLLGFFLGVFLFMFLPWGLQWFGSRTPALIAMNASFASEMPGSTQHLQIIAALILLLATLVTAFFALKKDFWLPLFIAVVCDILLLILMHFLQEIRLDIIDLLPNTVYSIYLGYHIFSKERSVI